MVPPIGIIHVYQDGDPTVFLSIFVVKKLYATTGLPNESTPPVPDGIFWVTIVGNEPLFQPGKPKYVFMSESNVTGLELGCDPLVKPKKLDPLPYI